MVTFQTLNSHDDVSIQDLTQQQDDIDDLLNEYQNILKLVSSGGRDLAKEKVKLMICHPYCRKL